MLKVIIVLRLMTSKHLNLLKLSRKLTRRIRLNRRKEYDALTPSGQRDWKKNNPTKAKAIGV
jgi:hypothetical protein